MIKVPVLNPEGKEVGSVDIDPAEFGGSVNKQLLHDAVLMYQANRRAGTHKTKSRGEVAGTGKKVLRQKGSGSARAGTKRTHKRRGGGTAFGPVPRDYSYAMPKRQRQLATKMALLSKFQDNEAVVVDGLALERPKTKQMAGILKALGLGDKTCLVATNGMDKGIYLSGRNIDGVDVLPAAELNAFALLRRKRLLLTKAALEDLRARAQADLKAKAAAKAEA
ncbi:MAG TPA: 50S ribosomal protein L4 [Planctomycetia bacterium]|nr:50S ribosomal protein L4 [Planctomycetia bacterium]